jgi:phosphomannomutase/phosphoglucomutase
MLTDFPTTYSTPELRVGCPEAYKFEVVRQAQEYFTKRFKTVTVDGVRVIFEDGWGLIRASNTQPILVLRFEADTEERLAEIRRLVESQLSRIVAKVSSGV